MAFHGHDHGHENVTVDWDSIKWDELSQEERFNLEHIRYHICIITLCQSTTLLFQRNYLHPA